MPELPTLLLAKEHLPETGGRYAPENCKHINVSHIVLMLDVTGSAGERIRATRRLPDFSRELCVLWRCVLEVLF